MSKWIYKFIWDISEFTGIGLGKFAPYVFHQILGGDMEAEKVGNRLSLENMESGG